MDKIARMRELGELLRNASRAYYQQDREIMRNLEYDKLYDELEALEKETGTVLAGSPTVTVGYEAVDELPKERHESPMLSLDKTKDVNELATFAGEHEVLLSWKLDGLTVVLTYENGELSKAVTRGNGEIGEVITNNARVFRNIPLNIAHKGETILRGEAVIRYSDFEKINAEIADEAAKYKNPRNLCSGSVRQLNNEITAKRNVYFYAFALVKADGVDFHNSREQQFLWMKEQGFEFKTTFSSTSEKESYSNEYDELYNTCKKSLYSAGYRIYTSINMEKQKQLQDSVSSQLSMFTEKTDDGVYKVQGAAVSIDNSTGKVAAIVGGREEDQEGYGLNRAYQSFRQPGSAIKPLLVYTPALEKGYTPNSTLDDSRMTGNDAVSNAGYSYSGSISLRRAVEKSSNVATYRLYEELGTRTCMKYLEALNFKGLDKKDYKYNTTCLGGFTNGTTVVEMAAGYATIANDGEYRTPDCIIKITDAKGNDIVPEDTSTKSVYSSSASRMMTSVLQSCVTEYEGTAHVCQLDVDMPAACKTGTTNNYVDGWLCGYTPYYTTAVWVGMDVYKSVDNLKGNTYPASIWTNYMNKIHQGLPRKEFESYLGDTESTTEATTESTEDDTESTTEATTEVIEDDDTTSNTTEADDSGNDSNNYYDQDDYNNDDSDNDNNHNNNYNNGNNNNGNNDSYDNGYSGDGGVDSGNDSDSGENSDGEEGE